MSLGHRWVSGDNDVRTYSWLGGRMTRNDWVGESIHWKGGKGGVYLYEKR